MVGVLLARWSCRTESARSRGSWGLVSKSTEEVLGPSTRGGGRNAAEEMGWAPGAAEGPSWCLQASCSLLISGSEGKLQVTGREQTQSESAVWGGDGRFWGAKPQKPCSSPGTADTHMAAL